jgi:hypothetical protein
MKVFLIAWPDASYSLYCASFPATLEHVRQAADISDNPHAATIMQVRLENDEFYAEIPDGLCVPDAHIGSLTVRQLRPPYGKIFQKDEQETQAFLDSYNHKDKEEGR